MSTDPIDGHPGAEVIELRPDAGVPESAPERPAEAEPVITEEPGTRRAVIPEAWQRANIRSTLGFHAGLNWHRAKYHGFRLPAYVTRTVLWAGLGVHRIIGTVLAWWHWVDGWVLESQAVAKGPAGHAEAMAAHKEGKKTRASRGRIVAVCAVTFLFLAGLLIYVLPWWGWLGVAAVALPPLAWCGKPAGKPLASAAVVPARFIEPTPAMINDALAKLGLPALAKAVLEGADMQRTPVHKDGPGWAVRLELPQGVTAVEVIEKRDKLAGNLRRPLSATWPLPVSAEHPGMLDLWIGYTALNKQAPVKWPLADAGKADLFQPVPFGADQRGNVVFIVLMYCAMLIGAMPRMGKTFALRIVMLACALDPNARLRVWELKGTGDLAAAKHVAHEYGSGADRETLEACLASVRNYHGQLDPRAKTLREIAEKSPELVPENKVTPEVSGRRGLGLFPDVLIIDEAQEAFGDPDLGGEFEALLTPVTKRGPALGMMLVLATQRPDKKSCPTGITANVAIRFCLKVMSYIASNMVLGDGMSTQGFNAADFTRSDKGIGWLTGEADDPQIVRGCYIDAPKAEKIALRARAARAAAGTLSGFALGEQDETQARDFLADVLAVFGADEKLWSETIAQRLMDAMPEAYDALTKESVASQLRAAGVDVKQVREAGRGVRAGCERAAVAAVAADRGQP
ncbi:MAG: cell division protein FtsK [Streptosporangiales bacterium]